MLTELWITYPEMYVLAHTRLTIISGLLMPCLETTCMVSFVDVSLHQIFLSDNLKVLILLTNLDFFHHFNALV